MSRTFRRKGYETGRRPGCQSKIAGYYTKEDVIKYDADPKNGFTHPTYVHVIRAPTKVEYYKDYWKLHGDNNQGIWNLHKITRHNRMMQNRRINKNEICKWIKNEEYEPLTEDNPRSNAWDD